MKMKKFLIVSVAALSLFAVGCGKKKNDEKTDGKGTAAKSKQEEVMEKYAKDYYVKFMNKYLTDPVVSLEDLRKSNEGGYTDYDLKELEKCKDTSTTDLKLKEGTNEVIGFTHHLDCEK